MDRVKATKIPVGKRKLQVSSLVLWRERELHISLVGWRELGQLYSTRSPHTGYDIASGSIKAGKSKVELL